MFYHEGEFHLHYLGQPEKPGGWGDRWVHLVSKDMLHWQELALSVPSAGGSIGGGSVVVDAKNTSGLQSGEEKPLVLFWNSMQSIANDGFVGGIRKREQKVHSAHSTDRGRSWTPHAGNPILTATDGNGDFRDPSVIWHEASQRWIMLVCRGYHDFCDVFASPDLENLAARRQSSERRGAAPPPASGAWHLGDEMGLPRRRLSHVTAAARREVFCRRFRWEELHRRVRRTASRRQSLRRPQF